MFLTCIIGQAQAKKCSAAPKSTPFTWTNPVIKMNFPDPGTVADGDLYHSYATNSGGMNVQYTKSSNLRDWQKPVEVLPTLPAWAKVGRTWAPEVTKINSNSYTMYFTAWHSTSDRECVGVATATSFDGPFVSQASSPLICPLDLGGAIDPSPYYENSSGTRYVVYKNDGNCCGYTTTLWLQQVDTTTGTTLIGSPAALTTPQQAWQGNLIEAPFLTKYNDFYHLFFSANTYGNSNYNIGHAYSSALTGPYTQAQGPLLQDVDKLIGPGGQNVVTSPNGQLWLVYHSWIDSTFSTRVMDISPMSFAKNGSVTITATYGQRHQIAQ